MFDILSYGFMQRALVTAVFISLTCSVLGVFLFFKRYSLVGDGLAHVAFGGVATGLLFGVSPFFSALIFSVIGALTMLKLKYRGVYGDVSIGIVSHASLGIGVFLISISSGMNVDVLSFLFGSILSITFFETLLSVGLASIVILFILFNYKGLFAVSFDEESAHTLGYNVKTLNYMLMFLVAVTIIISMRVTGLLLASALMIIPGATAIQFSKSFKRVVINAGLIGIISSITGILLAIWLNSAVSGTIILTCFAFFLLASFKKLF